MTPNTFKKEERLCSHKTIADVVSNGHSFLVHPFRVSFLPSTHAGQYPAQILTGVSKRNFKRAVDRNRIKRLMREAYRKNKNILYTHLEKHNTKLAVMLIYIGKQLPEYQETEDKIILTLQRLCEEHAALENTQEQ